MNYTPFSDVYTNFLSKITDDMYMELTPQDTKAILEELIINAVPKFEFPRQDLSYELRDLGNQDDEGNPIEELVFVNELTNQEVNIVTTYMIVEWIGQQLASVENVRMKYSGSNLAL